MKYAFSIIGLLIFNWGFTQTYQPEKINKKAIQVYEQAIEYLRDDMLEEAIPFLQKAITLDTNYVDAILSMAGVCGRLKKHDASIKWYELAKRKDTAYFSQYHLPYSINLAGMGKFEEALQAVEYFLTIPKISDNSIKAGNYRKRCYQFAIQFQQQFHSSNYNFNPSNLGDSINTEKSEYYPTLSADDSLLIFCRRAEGIRENFMQSRLLPNGKYSKATLLNGSINEEPSKGAITMSADGDWIIFAGNFGRNKGFGDFDLYISYYTPEGWSTPENLGDNINTDFWESSPSLSPDKRVLYFSSNRYGGVGGKDLYYSVRMNNGKFGPAQNMGDSINTKGDEHSPYIHPDNQTLYFTSDGLQGYGGSDIFIMRKKLDGGWTTPQNLGYPINTIDDEGYFTASSNGQTAYYASNRSDSKGGLDLYKFEIRKEFRAARTLYVKGNVLDSKTNKGIPCTIDLIENNTANTLMKVQTNETGAYFVTLPTGNNYTFMVNRKGYLYYTSNFNLVDKEADSVYTQDIFLTPVSINANLVLKNIEFEINSFKLKPSSFIELNKLVELLQENSNVKAEINGHTDNIGQKLDNVTLSTNRAKAVVDYLISKNIAASRLSYKGYGSEKPIADNNTEKGRAKNRRTEVRIISL